jgi:alcohol dehydrogenase class IV
MRVEPTLNAAALNFKAAGRRIDGLLGVLLLTQALAVEDHCTATNPRALGEPEARQLYEEAW